MWKSIRILIEQNKKLKIKGKPTLSLLSNRGLTSVLPFLLLGFPLIIAMATLKIHDQSDFEIGVSLTFSLLWMFTRDLFFFCSMRFQPALIESLLKGQRACDEALRSNRMLANLILFLIVAPNFLVFIPLIRGQAPGIPFNDFYWGKFTFVFLNSLFAIVMVLSLYQSLLATKKIDEVLIASYEVTKNQRTLDIAEELKRLQQSFRRRQWFLVILHVFTSVFPFMWDKHDYLFPLSALMISVTIFSAFKTVYMIQVGPKGTTHTEIVSASSERQ